MISARSSERPYLTELTNGIHEASADSAADKGGDGAGFRPHELLEASLASCMNIWIRMYADHQEISLERVATVVRLDRTRPERPAFEYEIDLEGSFSEAERLKLLEIAPTCPVRRTLSGELSFRAGEASAS